MDPTIKPDRGALLAGAKNRLGADTP